MCWKYLVTICVVFAYVYGQELEISPRYAERHVGDNFTVLCKVPYPINECRVIVGSTLYQVLPGVKDAEVVYAGRGLENGECGGLIRRLYEEWNGTISCALSISYGKGILVTGSMHLLVTRTGPPTQIFIEGGTGDIIIEKKQTLTLKKACILLNVAGNWKYRWLTWKQRRPQNGIKGLIIELGTHLDLTSFVVEVNNQGIDSSYDDVVLASPVHTPQTSVMLDYLLTEADDNSSIYCVAEFSSNFEPLESPAIKIRVNRKSDSPVPDNMRKAESSNATMIWMSTVGAVGVLCGAALIGGLIYRKRQKTTQTCADNNQEDPQEPVYSYVAINSMPLYDARALIASNTRLGPAAFVPPLPPPREGTEYAYAL